MAQSWGVELSGAQAADVNVYQSCLVATYQNNGIVDLDGDAVDLGAPKVMSARLTVVALDGATPKLDVKLQHRAASTDSWADVTDGAFTQATAAGEELLAVITHRFVRVVTNFTDTITESDFNVVLTMNN